MHASGVEARFSVCINVHILTVGQAFCTFCMTHMYFSRKLRLGDDIDSCAYMLDPRASHVLDAREVCHVNGLHPQQRQIKLR